MSSFSRRPFSTTFAFALVVAPLAAFVGGCSAADDGAHTSEQDLWSHGKVPASWDRPVSRPQNESVASHARQECQFRKGDMPAHTLGAELPVDGDIPIKNIIVLMQENRSFDSYFGHLARYAGRSDIESAPESAYNPERVDDPNGARRAWQHAETLCISDTNHEWAGSHREWNGGKMNGFFQANQGFVEDGQPAVSGSLVSGDRALWWYDERDIPFYYELASTFAIGDHYHSSLLGPTWPNRDYLYGATSRGVTTNVRPTGKDLSFPANDAVIFDELERRRVSWTIFVEGLPAPRVGTFLTPTQLLTRWAGVHVEPMFMFYEHAKRGTLPQVAFIDANVHETVNGDDEHPPGDIQLGQKFVSDVVHAVFRSPQWKDIAMFFTYDEHGGLYDHVAPPPACAPDDIAPDLRSDEDREFPGAFDRLGMRVPITVISPYTKQGYVSHHVYDHTSITRFIEAKFKVPALSNRDANADAMFDFFDFENPPFMTPPYLPEATVDQDRLHECQALFAK